MTDGQIRILVVDDDPALLDTIREYLESPGNRYVVETATRGGEALKLVARARPHVAILDVEMPTIPVIMLTANTDGSVAAETLKLGAVSYAPKPLDVRYLDHLVATFATKPRKGSSA